MPEPTVPPSVPLPVVPDLPADETMPGLNRDGSWTLDGESLHVYSPVCTSCQWMGNPARRTCMAFPDGIPESIWLGANPHTTPYPGDHGYQFTPLPGSAATAETLEKAVSGRVAEQAVARPRAPRGGQGHYRGGEFVPAGSTGVPAAAGSASSREAVLLQCERQLLGLPHERGIWVNAAGQVVGARDGTADEIRFSPEESASMRGCVLTHNHPSGNSFSPTDVCFAACNDLAAIHAVGTHPETGFTVRYILEPPAGGWGRGWWGERGAREFRRAETQVFLRNYERIGSGAMTTAEANATHANDVMRAWAAAVGAAYRVEPLPMAPHSVAKALRPETTFRLLQRYETEAHRAGAEPLFPALLKSCHVHGIVPPEWLRKSQLSLFSEDDHPRQPAGTQGGKYKPGEWIPRSQVAAKPVPALGKPVPQAPDPVSPDLRELQPALRTGGPHVDAPAGWTPAAETVDADAHVRNHTLGRNFIRAGKFYKPQFGYGPPVLHAEGEERRWMRTRYPTPELELLDAVKDLPATPKQYQPVTVEGEPYIEFPEMTPIDPENRNHLMMLGKPETLAALEETLREMDRRGVVYGDQLQFAYDPTQRKIILNDFSSGGIEKNGAWGSPNTQKWESFLKQYFPKQAAQRKAAENADWEKHKILAGQHYIYGGFNRPLYLGMGSYLKDRGVDPGSYEIVQQPADWGAGVPHFYLFSERPLPDEAIASQELTLLKQPRPGSKNDRGRTPDSQVSGPLRKALPASGGGRKRVARTAPKTQDWEHSLEGLEPEDHTAHMRHHEAEYRALQHQLMECPPDDAEGKRKIVQAMRTLALHWNAHRRRKYVTEQRRRDGGKLPKLVLKSMGGSLLKAARKKGAVPAPAQGALFAEDEHPRQPAGTTSGKYKPGEWVPRGQAGSGAARPIVAPPRKLTAKEAKQVDALLTAGVAEIQPKGDGFELKVRPTGAPRMKRVGSYPTIAHAQAAVLAAVGEGVKAYADVGEKIGGARKDIVDARQSFLDQPDLERLEALEQEDPDAAARTITKANVWPKPDRNAARPLGLKTLEAILWKLLAAKPDGLTPEHRAAYVRGVQVFQQLAGESRSAGELFEKLQGLDRELDVLRRWTSDQSLIRQGARILNPAPPPTVYQVAMALAVFSHPDVFEWLRGKKQIQGEKMYTDRSILPKLDSGEPFVAVDRAKDAEERKFREARNARYVENARSRATKILDSILGLAEPAPKKPAGATAPGAVQEEGTDEHGRKQRWQRSVPTDYERKGGKPISIRRPEDYLSRFGLRGVEFGNWMDDAASKVHVDRCAEAFQDLADMMGLPARDVSLNGRLALAFGARGKGLAAAHYEPLKQVINLTKGGGAGSLGHEWGHFLDNVISEMYPGNGGHAGASREGKVTSASRDAARTAALAALGAKGTFVSCGRYTSLLQSPEPVLRAVGKIMQLIQEGDGREAVKVKPTRYRSWAPADDALKLHPDDPQAALDHAIAKGWVRSDKYRREMVDYLGSKTGKTTLTLPTGRSQYASRCGAMGDYYARPEELFARAFETYLLDAGAKKKRANNYLVHVGKGDQQNGPYPTGAERQALTAAFEDLVQTLKADRFFEKALRHMDPSFDGEHADECCPHCGARQERGDDGTCNRCGKDWPLAKGFRPGDHLLKSAGGHKYGCVLLTLSEDAADILRSFAHRHISPEDLAEDGFDKEPHVTVLYGLTDPNPAPLLAKVQGFGKVAVAVGQVSVFETPEYDVVKIDVGSRGLRKLNARLAELPHVNTHPEYKPHLTLAYVKPGMGAKYAGSCPLTGEALVFDQAVFSSAAGERSVLPLSTASRMRYVTGPAAPKRKPGLRRVSLRRVSLRKAVPVGPGRYLTKEELRAYGKKPEELKDADEETLAIRLRATGYKARHPHRFEPARWTHPNGHPRCAVCGDEERLGGQCAGRDADPVRKGYDPDEPRDERGRWTDEGGAGEPDTSAETPEAHIQNMSRKYGKDWFMQLHDAEENHFHRLRNQRNAEYRKRFAEFGIDAVTNDWEASYEGRAGLERAHQILADLAHVLDLPPRMLSLNGRLRVSFGTSVGTSQASYARGSQRLDIGVTNGQTIVHEWGHFLDNMLATLYREHGFRGGMASEAVEHGTEHGANRSLKADPEGFAHQKVRHAVEHLVALFHRDPDYSTPLAELGRDADRQLAERFEEHREVNAEGRVVPKSYYGSNAEMFARAFETYVRNRSMFGERKLKDSPLQENLAKHPQLPVYAAPLSRYATALGQAFDHLFAVLKEDDFFQKALAHLDAGDPLEKARKLQGRLVFQGLPISIENRRGSVRRGKDADGTPWETKMFWRYGYLRGTLGPDGDHLDCYVGPNPESRTVFIVHQKDPETGLWDEDKIMFGWDDATAARDAYLAHYNSHKFLGPMTTMSMEEFQRILAARKLHRQPITAQGEAC